MAIKDREIINVLNYGKNLVCVSTRDSSFGIPSCDDDGNPSVMPFSPSEITNINSNSNAFKSGFLRFEEEDEREVYEDLLRIKNWNDILKDSEIEELIVNPTKEGMKQIVAITNNSIFERIRGILTRIKNEGKYDVVNRVDNIINQRYLELGNGITKSGISLDGLSFDRKTNDNVAELETQNVALQTEKEAMEKQLAEMQKKLDELTKAKATENKAIAQCADVAVSNETVQAKKPASGRAKKSE